MDNGDGKMTLEIVVILGLATWRLASMLVKEAGPFHVFTKIRAKAGIIHDGDEIEQVPDRLVAGILSCIWCSSIWIAGIIFLLWMLSPLVVEVVGAFLAMSAIAIGYERWMR